MAINKEFFRKINQDRMSPMATQREIQQVKSNLPISLNHEDMRFLERRYFIRSVSTYSLTQAVVRADFHYIRVEDNSNDGEHWVLHIRESGTVFRSEDTGSYIDVSADRPSMKEVTYLTGMPMYHFETYGLPNGFRWSRVRNKTVNYVTDYLKPNILARYAMFQRPTNGLSNVLIDSFVPKLMYQHNFDINYIRKESNLPSTALTISPWFSALFQTKQIEVEQMARILGYSKKDIKNLLVAVKKKQHDVTFIGYGGTNVNTIHWITEMCSFTHTLHPFKKVAVYEPDVLEISNMLRFPKNPEAIITQDVRYPAKKHSKLILLTDYELKTLSKTKPTIHAKRIGRMDIRHGSIKDTIIYGAPSLNTREMLNKEDVRFLSATHTGNSCYIHSNPVQDGDLQVETYGLIQLSIFFMNQLKLAISFLEILANDEVDLFAKDVEHLNYTFNQDASLTTDRKYNFQLDHDGHMVTEEQANAVV